MSAELEQRQREEAELREHLQSYERQAQNPEKELAAQSEIPQASMFSYKVALETAQEIIERQKKALAAKSIITAQNENRQKEIASLHETVNALNEKFTQLETAKAKEDALNNASLKHWYKEYEKVAAQLEDINKFFRWNPEANKMHLNYLQEQREEARRKEAEQKRLAQERERQEQREREEKERREAELAREQKAQELERERQRAQSL